MSIINEKKDNCELINQQIGQFSECKNTDNAEQNYIDFGDFMKVQMRVGRVIEASEPEWSNKLIKQIVDFGPEIGQKVIFSGIRKWYGATDIQDKILAYVTNLAPRKMGKEISEGMILAVTDQEGKPILWQMPENVKLGELIG